MMPKPPIKNMTDFVVFCFVSIVVITLLGSVIGVFVGGILNPDADRSNIINMLADIMTTLIGALVGFIAGKGSGRAEAQEERDEERRQEKADKDE